MTKKITQEELLRAMMNPEKLKALLLTTESIFLETIRLDLEGAEITFWTCSKYTPTQLFEEGLQLLGKLPIEERKMVLKNLQKLNIPSTLWYKITEDITSSSVLQSKPKELQMPDKENTGSSTSPDQTFMEKMKSHSGFFKTILWMGLGAALSLSIKAGIDKYRSSAAPAPDVGSGE